MRLRLVLLGRENMVQFRGKIRLINPPLVIRGLIGITDTVQIQVSKGFNLPSEVERAKISIGRYFGGWN